MLYFLNRIPIRQARWAGIIRWPWCFYGPLIIFLEECLHRDSGFGTEIVFISAFARNRHKMCTRCNIGFGPSLLYSYTNVYYIRKQNSYIKYRTRKIFIIYYYYPWKEEQKGVNNFSVSFNIKISSYIEYPYIYTRVYILVRYIMFR